MKIYKKNNKVWIDYENNYPIEPLTLSISNAVISRAKLKTNGRKAPLIDSIKAAIKAFKTVRYGQFIDKGKDSMYVNCN